MESSELCISDLGQAAYLRAMGHTFVGLEESGRGRYSFRFADQDGHTSKDAAAYFGGAMVPARDFMESLKTLKEILYSTKRRNGDGKPLGYTCSADK